MCIYKYYARLCRAPRVYSTLTKHGCKCCRSRCRANVSPVQARKNSAHLPAPQHHRVAIAPQPTNQPTRLRRHAQRSWCLSDHWKTEIPCLLRRLVEPYRVINSVQRVSSASPDCFFYHQISENENVHVQAWPQNRREETNLIFWGILKETVWTGRASLW